MKRLPPPCPPRAPQRPQNRAAVALGALLVLCAGAAGAGTPLPEDLAERVRQMTGDAAALVLAGTTARVEVVVGTLDARLTLAPCDQVLPFLPAGTRPLGSLRIGLRCAKGSSPWRVTVPVAVRAWAPALVAASALPAGTVLKPGHLARAEVDLAARADAAIMRDQDALGRTLQRGLAAGEGLRANDLKLRQYFNAGDTVRVVAVGPGFSIAGAGQALGAGLEGRNIQVRVDGGRILTGVAVGEGRVEVPL